jgi:probable F420-dependent oxidoreductase
LKLSIFLFGLALDEYAPLIETAESSGYSAVWLGDHLVSPEHPQTPNPYGSSGHPGLDPSTPIADVWTTLAYAARSTSTIRLGTGVYILPLRNVIVTARSAASVQELSGGRLLFGVGTGWLREEFDALHESFPDRGERADEIIAALRLLWSGEPVAYSGCHVSFPEVRLAPTVQRAIPILAGGTSRRALERAAQHCDGWFGPSCGLQQSIDARLHIEETRRRLASTRSFSYHVRPDEMLDERMLSRYRDEGFDQITVSLKQIARKTPTTLDQRIACIAEAAERFCLSTGSAADRPTGS